MYGVLNGEAKGAVAEAVRDVKEAGLAGTAGGAVEVEPALADGDVEAGATGPDAGEDANAAAAVVAMVPLRSHGFGGEAISQIGGSKVHRNTSG